MHVEMLLAQVRKAERDTMREASLAGKVEILEVFWENLCYFAKESLSQD